VANKLNDMDWRVMCASRAAGCEGKAAQPKSPKSARSTSPWPSSGASSPNIRSRGARTPSRARVELIFSDFSDGFHHHRTILLQYGIKFA
jgi:hypothetical protein